MLKFERELRKQLEKLAEQLHETQQELRLSPEHIENVVKLGLALAGQPALIERKSQASGLIPGSERPAPSSDCLPSPE